jgi:CubicO group peptidase (beta-lactamase class C family)
VVIVASTTKGVTGLIGNMMIEQGKLDPEALVGRYWPEYAVNGKEETKVKYLFDHRAGLPDNPPGVDVTDWNAMVAALAASAPKWEPGTAHAYHSLTYGHLVGELIRRVSGETVGTYLRRHIGDPLGIDCWIGLPEAVDGRVAEVVMAGGPSERSGMWNNTAFRRAEIPAGNGHTNARALARLYAVLANGGDKDGVHMITGKTMDEATASYVTCRWFGMTDEMLAAAKVPDDVFKVRFARGFALSNDYAWMGPNPKAFGSGGSGGSLSFADRDARLSFGYAQNAHIGMTHDRTTRSGRLIQAVYDSL